MPCGTERHSPLATAPRRALNIDQETTTQRPTHEVTRCEENSTVNKKESTEESIQWTTSRSVNLANLAYVFHELDGRHIVKYREM